MKNILFVFILALIQLPAVAEFYTNATLAPPSQHAADTAGCCTVVELFTSEGCSSCPAADKVLAGIANTYQHKVIVLGFHVDYWNRLGWKDRFSDAAYSARQQKYAAAIPSVQVYTPQAIVNGEEEMVGSDKDRLLKSISKNKLVALSPRISLVARQSAHKNFIEVDYAYDATGGVELNIVLLQYNAITDVLAGENRGLTLHHANIVRNLMVAIHPTGKMQLGLPENTLAKDYRIVGYLQDKKSMKILGSTDYLVIQ